MTGIISGLATNMGVATIVMFVGSLFLTAIYVVLYEHVKRVEDNPKVGLLEVILSGLSVSFWKITMMLFITTSLLSTVAAR